MQIDGWVLGWGGGGGGGSQCSVREFKDRCFCYTADEKESAKPHDSGSQVQPPIALGCNKLVSS